jgi:hypothetical protein
VLNVVGANTRPYFREVHETLLIPAKLSSRSGEDVQRSERSDAGVVRW